MSLTAREIEDRFEEAAYTLRRLPEKDRPRGYWSSWPDVVQNAAHAYGYSPPKPMRVIPSAAAITRMEECFDWLMLIDPEDARIVWLRAENVRWRQVCIRAGVVRSTAWRRWAAALLTIAKKLDYQAKAKGKIKVAKPLAASTSATPRESRAKGAERVELRARQAASGVLRAGVSDGIVTLRRPMIGSITKGDAY